MRDTALSLGHYKTDIALRRAIKVLFPLLTIATTVVWFAEGLWVAAIPGTVIAIVLVILIQRRPRREVRLSKRSDEMTDKLSVRYFVFLLLLLLAVGFVSLVVLNTAGSVIANRQAHASPQLWIMQGVWWSFAVCSTIWMFVSEREWLELENRD